VGGQVFCNKVTMTFSKWLSLLIVILSFILAIILKDGGIAMTGFTSAAGLAISKNIKLNNKKLDNEY